MILSRWYTILHNNYYLGFEWYSSTQSVSLVYNQCMHIYVTTCKAANYFLEIPPVYLISKVIICIGFQHTTTTSGLNHKSNDKSNLKHYCIAGNFRGINFC